MFLRDIVAKLFIQYRTGLFDMELGRLAYNILDKNPDFKLDDRIADFDNLRILVILRCVEVKMDYTPLLEKQFNFKQMEELRQFMIRGIDFSSIYDESINHRVMELVRINKQAGRVIPNIDFKLYSFEQVEQIMLAASHNIYDKRLYNPKMTADDIEKLRKKLYNKNETYKIIMDTQYYNNIHNRIFGIQ